MTTELVGEVIGDRYALERELGHGGMATVYLARDLRQQQPVAVKVMLPGLATSLDSERFLREMGIAAALAHPLIVPLYDSGKAGGVPYYVMPYVEGESLYQRLQRERRLSLDDALRITRDVAAALGYAHSHGVLHRDVKPENVLLAGEQALVADFGLARAIGEADYKRLTETGVIVGTVYYMSPEQLREDRNLDQRTDIYSLGCIAYEMLTGEPPYTGPTLTHLINRIVKAPVPSVQRLNPAVPPAVDHAIGRALAKSPAERFATMEEFTAALPQGNTSSIAEAASNPAESGGRPDSPGSRPALPRDPAPEGTPADRSGQGGLLGGLHRALRALLPCRGSS
ncbi:MAG: serine/threonine-protein kinase [Gemmatimonadales bacterium]